MTKTNEREYDYSVSYAGKPAVGDVVLFDQPYDGFAGGVVDDAIAGSMGVILGVRIAPGRTVDTYWQRCTTVSELPPRDSEAADIARAKLRAIGAELLKMEDASGIMRSGWWLNGVWLAPTNDPAGAIRAIEGN